MRNKFIECGKIVTTQGIKGEVRVQPWCDSPDFLLDFKAFYVLKGEKKLEVISSRVQKNVVVIKFKEINSVEEAQALRNYVIYIERKSLKLPKGTYLVRDLIGLEVLDFETKKSYGKLCDVTKTGANDVYHIKTESGKTLLFPAIPDVVKNTDVDKGIIEITALKGLFDDED